MAKCHLDKILKEDFLKDDRDYLTPIQVGKYFTDLNIAPVHDDSGDNISFMNDRYCELTAMYWIWKNASSDWVGLCHYRRHFAMGKELIQHLPNLAVDVILPTPIFTVPSVASVYKRDHEAADWEVMMKILQNNAPDYYKTAKTFFTGAYYYGYNMLIARKSIFDAYCAWLFPLLTLIEEQCQCKRQGYQQRYIGFLAERLTSLYFVHNWKYYRVVHVMKHFYV